MTEREAFIESIAADPGDDTARLAFADWLQERGEDARAEFIRLACEVERQPRPRDGGAVPPSLAQVRAEALLALHWHEWFGPLLAAVGMPAPGPPRPPRVPGDGRRYGPYVLPFQPRSLSWLPLDFEADIALRRAGEPIPKTQFLEALRMDRGFVTGLDIAPGFAPSGCSLAAALRLEPIDRLAIRLDADPDLWDRLSHPTLRRVRYLDVQLAEYPDTQPDFSAGTERLLNDPHLTGVRDLHFTNGNDGYGHFRWLPAGVADALLRSPVAERCTSILCSLCDEGLRLLADARALGALLCLYLDARTSAPVLLSLTQYRDQLEELDLSGHFLDLATFGRGRPWARLRHLALNGLGEWFGNTGVLTNPDQFPALEELRVPVTGEFDADALAVAIRAGCFPRLVRLQLSDRNGSGSVVTVAEAVAGSTIQEFDARPMWNNITRADYQRVRELLGDRARMDEPHETNDDIPF